ncbi:MAG TPA: DUF1080 domain-containing protein [Bacteroidales bacterium]|nr:DUF1080 domain-containing protein [Bacteroidales bacterium]
MKKYMLILFPALLAANTCRETNYPDAGPNNELQNKLTHQQEEQGWILLFDGQTTKQWRGYNRTCLPTVWRVVDGKLHCVGADQREAEGLISGDIVFDKKFSDFELSLEWKISPGGNSGIFYLAQELPDFTIWQTAPEMQILDNQLHSDGQESKHRAGALYGLFGVRKDLPRPVGEWNHARIRVYRGKVEHWLNGRRVVRFNIWTNRWNELVANSKFPAYNPSWADVAREGYIGLQDHGHDVWFRNIKIRKLKPPA